MTTVTARAESSSTTLTSPPNTGDYACVLQDAFFYTHPDDNRGLFLLPKTYYVRLVTYGEEFCQVEYLTDGEQTQKLIGYAKTELLTFVDYVPLRPYVYYTFDLTYALGDGEIDSSFLTQITLPCAYYGDYKIGSKTYCYVLRGTQFGYVPKPFNLTYEENTEYAEYLESLQASASATPVESTTDNDTRTSPMQIGILIALCLLIPLLAALILKPPRRPPYDSE